MYFWLNGQNSDYFALFEIFKGLVRSILRLGTSLYMSGTDLMVCKDDTGEFFNSSIGQ